MNEDLNNGLTETLLVQQDDDSVRFIRFFDDIVEEPQSVKNPEGLVVLPNGNLLAIERQLSPENISNEITTDEEIVSFGDLPAAIAPINTAFDLQFNRLLGFNPIDNTLIEVQLGADGTLDPDTSTEIDGISFGIQEAQGIAVSPEGTLYLLDSAAQQIVVIDPGAEGNFETAAISEIDLPSQINNTARGIAFDPSNGNFQILDPVEGQLYEVNSTGQRVTTRDLPRLGVRDPQAIVFADSGDSTDDPEQQNLYVADRSLGIVELSIIGQDDDSVRFIRFFDDIFEEPQSVKNPEGLVVLPNGNLLAIERQLSPENISNEITTDEEIVSFADLPTGIAPINTAFDLQFNRLLGLNPIDNTLIEVQFGADGTLDPDTSTEIDGTFFGIQDAQGIAVSPEGTLYVLDSAAQQIVVIDPDAVGNFETAVISVIDLPPEINNTARGIAFDPSNGNFQILDPVERQLYEFNSTRQQVSARDLSELGLKDPQAIIWADSGDSTDDPEQQSLYVADQGLGIVELSLIDDQTPAQVPTSSQSLVLVQTIEPSEFSPASSDPSGITYLSSANRLVIADAEVNETVGIPFEEVNLWEITPSGGEEGIGNTTAFSDEPTGISFDPNFGSNGRFFISDDNGDRGIYISHPGSDALPGGGDDTMVRFLNSDNFGSADPEGVTYAVVESQEVLFIVDGVDNEVYQVDLAGQLLDHWDTTRFGLRDPQGIEFDPVSGHLFLVSAAEESLFEVTPDGTLVNQYDISAANTLKPSGVALAPSSNDSSRTSVYITDRGIDNNQDPNAHNDGKVHEFFLTPAQSHEIYVSLRSNGDVGGISFKDEDILQFSESTGTWAKYFDGSDVDISGNIDAFHIDTDGSILLSLQSSTTLPDIGMIHDSDIVRFIPTSLGDHTAGSFAWFFDGSDVGLDASGEDIDAIGFAPDGRLTVSTTGPSDVVSDARDEDLLIFNDTSLGETTSGTWDLYFEGSDVGLNNRSSEDVYGTWIDPATGEIYLGTKGAFAVSDISGDKVDILAFDPTSTGSTTSGSFSLFFDGSAHGLAGENIDGFYLDFI